MCSPGRWSTSTSPSGWTRSVAEVRYHDLVEGVFEVGDATIRTQYLNHPALTLGYRIEADGATVVYASDHEPHDAALAGGGVPRLAERRRAACRRSSRMPTSWCTTRSTTPPGTPPRSAGATARWSTRSTLAGALPGRRLVLYHHDPQRDDDGVDDLLRRARAWRPPRA